MNPLVICALIVAMVGTPGGMTLIMPSALLRLLRMIRSFRAATGEGSPTDEVPTLVGSHMLGAIMLMSFGCTQLPLPWNLLENTTIVGLGYTTDVLIFLICMGLGLSMAVRWSPQPSFVVACASLVVGVVTLMSGVESVSFIAVVNSPTAREGVLLVLVAAMSVVSLPPLMAAANGWLRSSLAFAIGVAAIETSCALLQQQLNPRGVVGWLGYLVTLLVFLIVVERWGRRSVWVCRWCAAGAALLAVAVLIIGFVQ